MTSNKNIADRIRSEHEFVSDLTGRLLQKVAVLPRSNQARWIAEASASFNEVRTHLMQHMSLEEEDGYLASVVDQRPGLSTEVDRLAHEHVEMARIMADIARQLESLRPEDSLLIRDVARRIQNFIQYLEHHEKDENLLVQSVFMDDLGTED
jgi:hemerythrin-like domain-containing protein